jgi:hypothetical protein
MSSIQLKNAPTYAYGRDGELIRSGFRSSSRFRSSTRHPIVQVGRDGSLSGKALPAADGSVKLPNGLKLQAPPVGGLTTHQLSPNQLLVLSRNKDGSVSVSTKGLGIAVDREKATLKGSVLPVEVNGKKMVELPVLGQMPAPAPGKTDSYLMAEDKLLSLTSAADGTVAVNTRTLGIEPDKKGNFKGAVLPGPDGKVDLGGKQLDVSGLQPGQSMKKTVKINGKKVKVKVTMNADGSVSVEGKRKRSFLSKVAGAIGKVLNTVGKFAPFLAAIPGLGWATLVAKGVGLFNAAKGVIDGIKSGNWLGAVTSAASFIGGAVKGAVGAFASKVADVGNFVQTAVGTFTHGLGKGLLQVVSNGANLLSSAAGVAGNFGQGKFQNDAYRLAVDAGKVASYAGALDAAGRGDLMPGAALVANTWGADLIRQATQPKPVRFDTNPTLDAFGGAEALAQIDAILNGNFTMPLDTTVPTTGTYRANEVLVASGIGGHPGKVIGSWSTNGQVVREHYQNGQQVVIARGPNGEVLRQVDQRVRSLPLMDQAFSIPRWRRDQLTELVYGLIHKHGGGRPVTHRNGTTKPELSYNDMANILAEIATFRALTETEKTYVAGTIAGLKGPAPAGANVFGGFDGYYRIDVSDSAPETRDSDPGRVNASPAHVFINTITDTYHGPMGNIGVDLAAQSRRIRQRETGRFGLNLGDAIASERTALAHRVLITEGFARYAEVWRQLFVQ